MTRIDWFRCVDKQTTNDKGFSAWIFDLLGTYIETKPFFGYKSAIRFECGATFHWHYDRPDMGRMWDFSGSTITELGQEAIHVIASTACRHDAVNFRRIDLAHDVFNGEATIENIHKALLAGFESGECRKRTYNPTLGVTKRILELGSRSSDLFCRVYDKGLEQNIVNAKFDDWIRFEFEVKGDMAQALKSELVKHGDMKFSDFAAGAWLGLFMSFFPQNQAVLGTWFDWGITPIWGALPQKTPDTRYWLENQVKSGILNYVRSHEGGATWLADYFSSIVEALEVTK